MDVIVSKTAPEKLWDATLGKIFRRQDKAVEARKLCAQPLVTYTIPVEVSEGCEQPSGSSEDAPTSPRNSAKKWGKKEKMPYFTNAGNRRVGEVAGIDGDEVVLKPRHGHHIRRRFDPACLPA